MLHKCALSPFGSMTNSPERPEKPKKRRVDHLLVERDLVESRTRAQALVMGTHSECASITLVPICICLYESAVS